MLTKKIKPTSLFLLSILLGHITEAANNPERKRYVSSVYTDEERQFRSISAIKIGNTYTQVIPFGQQSWWNGLDIAENQDDNIFPLISSLDQLGYNQLNVQVNYNGVPRNMEFISLLDRNYKVHGNQNEANCICDNCERHMHPDENAFSYVCYREYGNAGLLDSYEVCLNCLQGQVQKKKWEIEKEETVQEWQAHSMHWPGCDTNNGFPIDLVSVLYDYTEPTPPIKLKPKFKVVWPMDANTQNLTLQMQLSEKNQALDNLQDAYNQLENSYKKTNQPNQIISILLGGSIILIPVLVLKKENTQRKKSQNKKKSSHKKRKNPKAKNALL